MLYDDQLCLELEMMAKPMRDDVLAKLIEHTPQDKRASVFLEGRWWNAWVPFNQARCN